MQNKNLDYFKKGKFEYINKEFMKDGVVALTQLSDFQKKYKKYDMDTLLNELHDSIVGYYLGFELINTEKHGFDCKYSTNANIFLESKVASYSASTWNATFNDTTYEKAETFKDSKVWLALSLWESTSKLMCICYGQNELIGNFLKQKVDHFKAGNVVRSTQSLSMSTLVFNYGFDILSIAYEKQELKNRLILGNSSFKKLSFSKIYTLEDFVEPYELKIKLAI